MVVIYSGEAPKDGVAGLRLTMLLLLSLLTVVEPPKVEFLDYVADAPVTSGQEKSKDKDHEKDKRDEKPPITACLKSVTYFTCLLMGLEATYHCLLQVSYLFYLPIILLMG